MLSKEERDALTPAAVLTRLREGNARFVADALTTRDHPARRQRAALGQYPMAIVLSCVDSRVPVEEVFDQGIGDIFVARVAGNFANTDILGSMEFACKVAGAKAVFVLGHESCGAIMSAIDNAELGNVTAMLENLKPAVAQTSQYSGERTSGNPNYVHLVAQENVRLTMDKILAESEVLRGMEAAGELAVAGGMYDLSSGAVTMLDG